MSIEIIDANPDQLIAATWFYVRRSSRPWRDLLDTDGFFGWSHVGELVASGEYTDDQVFRLCKGIADRLGVPFEEIAGLRARYSVFDGNLAKARYAVELVVLEAFLKLIGIIPRHHRLVVLEYCVGLVGASGRIDASREAARERPPTKVTDVLHIYKRMLEKGLIG